MSGVYIKGMEMPKTGEYRCVIRKWGEEITVDLYGDEELCGKLIPVPEHGDLVDRDALLEEATALGTLEWEGSYFAPKLENVVLEKDLMELPAVIPAD